MDINRLRHILKNKQPRNMNVHSLPKFLFLWLLFVLMLLISILMIISDLCKAGEEQKHVVVIDAGHGGVDPGMVANGQLEKDINLKIAKKLQEKLEANGFAVIMTRDEDEILALEGARNKKNSDLKQRVHVINESNADMFISIHQNSYSDESVCGAQTFYYETSKESEKFAKLLQNNIQKNVDENNHRQAKAGKDYYILKKSTCPGIILECGFMSCPRECANLINEAYQNKLVDAIADTIFQWYKKRPAV